MKNFKKILALGLSVSMLTLGNTSIIHAETQSPLAYTQGDINNSNLVDTTDVSYLKLFLNGSKTTAHSRMTERLDVDGNGIIDYRDVDIIRSILTHQINPNVIFYNNNSSLIKDASVLQYSKISLSNNTAYLSYYSLSTAGAIPETNSSVLSQNYDDELSLASESSSNDSGIVRLTVTIGGETHTETGFVVDDNVIMTAASNLCQKRTNGSWQYATSVSCDIYTISGTCVQSGENAIAYHIPTSFTTAVDNSGYNYAVIKLGDDVDLYDYKVDLGVPTTMYENNVCAISESRIHYGYGPTYHHLEGQKVYGDFINYYGGLGGVAYGSPVYVENNDSKITVIGVASKYITGITNFNRAVRINQDILRFVYNNSHL